MKSLYVEMLMGHKDALVKSYLRAKETEVISDFITYAADALTVDPTQRLIAENQALKSDRSQEMIELRALKKEMDGIKMLLDMTKNKGKLLDHLEQEAGIRVQMEGDDPDEYKRTQHK